MYKHTLRVNGEYLAKAQTLPASADAVGNGGSNKAGSTMGAVELVMAAAQDVTFPAGTRVTLQIEGSDNNADFTVLPVSFSKVTSGTVTTCRSGEEIARLPVPSNAPKYMRCRVGTDNSSVTGTVDVFCDFLPR